MTPAEVALWQLLRKRQLGVRFRRQAPVGPYIVDFLCVERRLIVELDGDHHFDAIDYDKSRDADLRLHGYRVLRFENDHLAEAPGDVLGEIRRAIG